MIAMSVAASPASGMGGGGGNIRDPVLLNLLNSLRKKVIKFSASLAFYNFFPNSFNEFNKA